MQLVVQRVDAAFATWTVAFWQPHSSDPLRKIVERIFYWDGLPDLPRERVFPNGRANLMLQLDDPYRPGFGPSRDPFPPLCVDGLWTVPNVVEAPPRRTRVIGIALTPAGAVKTLNIELAALSGATELENIVGSSARELGERASAARDVRSAVAATVAWLRDRLPRSRELSSDLAWLVHEIDVRRGALSVRQLMDSAVQSPSRLSARFRAHFGMSPKRFARIVRARRAIQLVCEGQAFADVALLAGYYDQAHLTSEFKSHTGMTPSAFLKANRYAGSSSIAEGEWDDFSKTVIAAAR
jgi:AraC-like DNA-binding protein